MFPKETAISLMYAALPRLARGNSHLVLLGLLWLTFFAIPGRSEAIQVVATLQGGVESLLVDRGTTYFIYWDIQGADNSFSCSEQWGDANGTVLDSQVIANSGSSAGPSGLIGFYTFSCTSPSAGTVSDSVYISEKVYVTANGQTSLTISPAQSYTLAWSTLNQRNVPCTMSYTSASGNGSFPVTQNTDGSGQTGLVGSYTLTCTGSQNQPVSATVTIAQYAPPTCSVTADANPIAYSGSTTLRWSSANATTMYLNNVGYVTPNVSSSSGVGPLSSTNYGGTAVGPGGTVTCPFTLTVNAPANCTFNGNTVNHSSNVTAYQAATVPYGSACVSETRTCTNGTLSGSYAFASCDVGPQCSLSLNPTSVTQGNSSTLSWTSENATSCTGDNFSTGSGSPTSGNLSVSPSTGTTYTASCTGAGGVAQCSGSGEGGIGAALAVSCTESWACTGVGSQTITKTNTDCSTENLATCELPEFCSAGSSVCIYNDIDGDIDATPRLVPSGETTEIEWSTDNASSCTVTGNGDTWTGTSGTETSSAITQFVMYTLSCDDADADTTQDDFTDSVTVFRVPSWFEF